MGASNEFKIHLQNGLAVTKNGYLYIYVSNETPNINVFFDNLQVTHVRGPLLEETHYSPWGLALAGISSKALNFGEPGNKRKYNKGTELNDTWDINLYETTFRSYDPQLGRFHQPEPLADYFESYSTYGYVLNNPIKYHDPHGLNPELPWNSLWNTPYGGTWTPQGGATPFTSDAQAFQTGANYLTQQDAWGTNGFASSFGFAQNAYYANGGMDPNVRNLHEMIIVYGNHQNGQWTTNNWLWPDWMTQGNAGAANEQNIITNTLDNRNVGLGMDMAGNMGYYAEKVLLDRSPFMTRSNIFRNINAPGVLNPIVRTQAGFSFQIKATTLNNIRTAGNIVNTASNFITIAKIGNDLRNGNIQGAINKTIITGAAGLANGIPVIGRGVSMAINYFSDDIEQGLTWIEDKVGDFFSSIF